jgi:hypothetical protein
MRLECLNGAIVVSPKGLDHLQAHPDVLALLPEAAAKVSLPEDGSFLATSVDMGRIVGNTGCVAVPETAWGQEVLFAQRVGRAKASRVVVGEGTPTNLVTILAFKGRDGDYVLVSAWIGQLAEKEPWDGSIQAGTDEEARSRAFWSRHALVHDSNVMSEPFTSSWEEVCGQVAV